MDANQKGLAKTNRLGTRMVRFKALTAYTSYVDGMRVIQNHHQNEDIWSISIGFSIQTGGQSIRCENTTSRKYQLVILNALFAHIGRNSNGPLESGYSFVI